MPVKSGKTTAVVIGGSNGIGLAIIKQLIQNGCFVYDLDICPPDKETLGEKEGFAYCPFHMLHMDEALLDRLKNEESLQMLMITAGLGWVSDFEGLKPWEIDRIMTTNATAVLKILRIFYDKIKQPSPFYCGVMASIAGLVTSPAFSVYAASKAALCRFVESVNIELEISGTKNRILNVSPGFLPGTRFYGGKNDMAKLEDVAKQILHRLFTSETLYIPDDNDTYKKVLDRYRENPHQFGLESYQYKKASSRMQEKRKPIIGYLSGTFDLFHVGHVRLLERAKAHCDYLIVGVHKDASHKNTETFIPLSERMEILNACKFVDRVVVACPEDSEAWHHWHFDRLFVGSDYQGSTRFLRYEAFFADKDVEILYFPYTKETNSRQIRKTILEKTKDILPEAVLERMNT